jgi:hypothetical protein
MRRRKKDEVKVFKERMTRNFVKLLMISIYILKISEKKCRKIHMNIKKTEKN